jgi:hypothetical protein
MGDDTFSGGALIGGYRHRRRYGSAIIGGRRRRYGGGSAYTQFVREHLSRVYHGMHSRGRAAVQRAMQHVAAMWRKRHGGGSLASRVRRTYARSRMMHAMPMF